MTKTKTKKTFKDTLRKVVSSTRRTAVSKTKTNKTITAASSSQKAIPLAKDLYIDYPKNNEKVYCGHYCFRLGSPSNISWLKISINGGAWQDCRFANGYWWFDWWNFPTGNFYAEAYGCVNGKEVKTAKRKFKVVI